MEIEISENVQYIIKELIRFLKKENLWNQFKIDFNPWVKLDNINLAHDVIREYNIQKGDAITLEELVQIRCYFTIFNGELSTLNCILDRVLVYSVCQYRGWPDIDTKWRSFFKEKLSPKIKYFQKC